MIRSRILYVIAASSLTAVLGVPASAAPDALSQAAPAGSRAIARGIIANLGAAASGADIVAVAWPNQDKLGAIGKGEPIPMYVIGRAKTNRAGGFTIDADPAAIPPDYRGKGDRVDVELTFGDSAREARWNYTATPDTAKGWVLTGTDAHQPNLRADLGRSVGYDLGNDPAAWVSPAGTTLGAAGRTGAPLRVSAISRDFTQLRTLPLTTLRATRMAPTSTSARSAAAVAAPTDICFGTWGSTQNGQEEYFARVYAWTGALATVYQQYGTDHTLGIGYSSSGFSQNGTSTISLNASASRSGVADVTAWNKVNYRAYTYSCRPGVEYRPISVNALLTKWTYWPHPTTWNTCTTYTSGTYTKSSGTNVTYSGGVSLTGIGSVSAQSGWNSDTKFSWTVKQRTKICGSTTAGWVSSPQAETHSG